MSKAVTEEQKARVRERARLWAAENTERKRAADRAYYEAHRELVKARARAWYESNPERGRATRRAWATAHQSEMSEYRRQYQVDHVEELRAYRASRRQIRASQQGDRRARLRRAFVEPVDRLTLYERDGGVCGLCGSPVEVSDFHVDHVVPLSRGGEHSYANTQIAHPSCNLSKHNRLQTAAA